MNHRLLFRAAAAWNIGMSSLVGIFHEQMLPLFGMPAKMTYPVFFYEFLALVFAFGIGYYWASKDFNKYAPVIEMGVTGKLLVFFTGIYWAIRGPSDGGCSWIVMGIFFVDLVFAVLFLKALYNLKKRAGIKTI